jgi:hypothetical protein
MRVSKELRRNQRNFAGTVNLTSPPCGSNATIATISAMGLSRTALRSIVSLEKMASAGSDGTSDLLRASAMALRQRHDMPLHDLDRMLELRREKMSGARHKSNAAYAAPSNAPTGLRT